MPYTSGEAAPKTGTYCVIDGSGNIINTLYLKEGETMPKIEDFYYEFLR